MSDRVGCSASSDRCAIMAVEDNVPTAEDVEETTSQEVQSATRSGPQSKPDPASARVFGIGELLEQILNHFAIQKLQSNTIELKTYSTHCHVNSHLVRELFSLQRVSRKCAETIRSSKTLRQHMLLETSSAPELQNTGRTGPCWTYEIPAHCILDKPLDWLFAVAGIPWPSNHTSFYPAKKSSADTYVIGTGVEHRFEHIEPIPDDELQLTYVCASWPGPQWTPQVPSVSNAFARSEASWRRIPLFVNTGVETIEIVVRFNARDEQKWTYARLEGKTLGDFYDEYIQRALKFLEQENNTTRLRWAEIPEVPRKRAIFAKSPRKLYRKEPVGKRAKIKRVLQECWSWFWGEQDWQKRSRRECAR